jgi:hypothetical protein
VTNPATGTKSIGLLADAQLSWFLQPHLDSFIVTRQLLPIYRNSAVWTVPSGREYSRPSTGTLQKRMPTPTQTVTPHTTGPLGERYSAHCRDGQRTKARVWQSIPAIVPYTAKHMLFFPTLDFFTTTILYL